jgi:hypothetical protein
MICTIFGKRNAANGRIYPVVLDLVASGHRMFLVEIPLAIIVLVLFGRVIKYCFIIAAIFRQETWQ